jgi:hypothetical protein
MIRFSTTHINRGVGYRNVVPALASSTRDGQLTICSPHSANSAEAFSTEHDEDIKWNHQHFKLNTTINSISWNPEGDLLVVAASKGDKTRILSHTYGGMDILRTCSHAIYNLYIFLPPYHV